MKVIHNQGRQWADALDKATLNDCKKDHCMVTETVSKEEFESRYLNNPLKYSKPDITITKAQGKLVSELIDFYIDRRAGSPAFNEDSLISLMAKLNLSGA